VLARLQDGPLAGAVVRALVQWRLPAPFIGVPEPVLDEADETFAWWTATYAFPPQEIPPRPGRLWRYRYVSSIPPS
jgi:hypothetical protein